MKEYELLLNSTYLYVLQHLTERPNFSKIAAETGLTRQTVAKQFEAFKDLENWNCFHIENFYNEEQDKYKRAIMILNDIVKEELTLNDIADKLGVSRASISKMKNHKRISCIYGIKNKGQVVYIGSTEDFYSRQTQHLLNIKNGLYSFCDKDATVEIIWQNCASKKERLDLEAQLIRFFQPVGNIEFKKM